MPADPAAAGRRALGAALGAAVSGAALAGAARANRFEALFAPRARLWPRWTAHDPGATLRVDHAAWDALVLRHRRPGADGIARFAYGAVAGADRAALAAYLAMLQAVPVARLPRAEQFAYWVNLYNALTVRVVLDAWPVRSIRDIDLGGSLIIGGPWDAALLRIAGEAVTLNDIEHRILRPIWRDPRIHYVVNCASLGCPDLPARALTAANAAALLADGARSYVNHPRGVTPGRRGLTVSSIYAWFAADFGGWDGIVPHLIEHAAPPLAEAIRRAPFLDAFAYDWAVNDAR
jgi:hypothetical protein